MEMRKDPQTVIRELSTENTMLKNTLKSYRSVFDGCFGDILDIVFSKGCISDDNTVFMVHLDAIGMGVIEYIREYSDRFRVKEEKK